MKIFDIPHFFRTIPLPTPPFFGEKVDPRSFWRMLRKLNPSLPFIKEGVPIMVAGLKCLKIMQFQRNLFYFKGLKLPNKMITK